MAEKRGQGQGQFLPMRDSGLFGGMTDVASMANGQEEKKKATQVLHRRTWGTGMRRTGTKPDLNPACFPSSLGGNPGLGLFSVGRMIACIA